MEREARFDGLQARVTDSGWILTLPDALFTSGKVGLRSDSAGNLNGLVEFLDTHPGCTVMIEGHTDSSGSESHNHSFSQRRADSVQSHLIEHGVHPKRIIALGKGESVPVAGNESEMGRRQNSRVEVILNNPPAAAN